MDRKTEKVRINVQGKEVEISAELIRKRGPPYDDYYQWGKWSAEGQEKALASVQSALEKLR